MSLFKYSIGAFAGEVCKTINNKFPSVQQFYWLPLVCCCTKEGVSGNLSVTMTPIVPLTTIVPYSTLTRWQWWTQLKTVNSSWKRVFGARWGQSVWTVSGVGPVISAETILFLRVGLWTVLWHSCSWLSPKERCFWYNCVTWEEWAPLWDNCSLTEGTYVRAEECYIQVMLADLIEWLI